MSLSSSSIQHPVATIMFFSALVLLGIISFQRLEVSLFPDLNYPKMLVRTRYTDAAPEEVVQFITRPIEEATSAVSGVRCIRSRSSRGLSIVTLEFYWGSNMDHASLKVRERLDEIQPVLPEFVERPELLRLDPSDQPIMEIVVSGADLDDLTSMCRDVIRRRMEQIRGVAMVEVVGGLDKQIEVQVNPDRLISHNVTIDDIARALYLNNLSLSGGSVKEGQYRRTLRIDGELHSFDDIEGIPVSDPSVHPPILLRDIANVFWATKERKSITRLNGLETIGLLVTKEASGNIVSISKLIQQLLNQIQMEYPMLKFQIVTQQSEFIENSLRNVSVSTMWGGVLALLVLFIFLRSIRHPLLISISMPVSIIGTFFFMHLTGISLNLMSLGGLALGVGMLVDNSIVVLENIFRVNGEGKESETSCIEGAEEVALPILASTFTTCAVFLPLIYVRGIAGRIFRDFSLTVIFSLCCSIIVALCLIPVMANYIKVGHCFRSKSTHSSPEKGDLKKCDYRLVNSDRHRYRSEKFHLLLVLRTVITSGFHGTFGTGFAFFGNIWSKFKNDYHTLLVFCLDHKKLMGLVIVILVIVTFCVANYLDWQLFPPLLTAETKYKFELSPGATLYQTAEVAAAIEKNLLSDSSVDYVFSRIGAHESILKSEDYEATYKGEIGIRMRKSNNIDLKSYTERLAELMPSQYTFKGEFESGQSLYRQFWGLVSSDVQVDVRGVSWEKLLPVAIRVSDGLEALPGVRKVNMSYKGRMPQIRVSLNRQVAARYGVSAAYIADFLRQRIRGKIATQIKEADRFIDVIVKPDIQWRDEWVDIVSQMIEINGRSIPLEELILWERVWASEELLRDNQEDVIQITLVTSGIAHRKSVRQAQQFISEMHLPENVRVVISGEEMEFQSTMKSIAMAILLSIILIYMILAAQLESLRYPLVIMMTVPLGIVGGIWMLAVSRCSINLISGIGFIILGGIVVNNAILMVTFIMKEQAKGKVIRESILEAGKKRLRPILMTTITTVVGSSPLAFAGGEGAELRQPLALVLIGGLIVATIFTLIVLPVIYEFLYRGK